MKLILLLLLNVLFAIIKIVIEKIITIKITLNRRVILKIRVNIILLQLRI